MSLYQSVPAVAVALHVAVATEFGSCLRRACPHGFLLAHRLHVSMATELAFALWMDSGRNWSVAG